MAYFPNFLSNLLEKIASHNQTPICDLRDSFLSCFQASAQYSGKPLNSAILPKNQLSHKNQPYCKRIYSIISPRKCKRMQLQFHKCYKNFRISQACICSCCSLWHPLLRGPAAGMFFPVPFQAMEMRPKIMEGFPDIIFRPRLIAMPGVTGT